MSKTTVARAIVQRGDTLKEEDVTLPPLEPHQMLVRVHYAAFNPTDNLAFGLNAFGDGAILGCDFAGTVEQLGDKVSKFAVGDKIAAFIWGGEIAGVGAYSEYCIADERIAFKVPGNVTLEQAATIPLAATTAFLALFSPDCLKLEQSSSAPKEPVLIWGGSSTVGSFAIQIAAIYGIPTIATSSQRNKETVSKDGAQAVFDYKNSDELARIPAKYPELDHVFDTIGSKETSSAAGSVIGGRKGKLCTVRPGKANTEQLPDNIEVHDVFVFTVFAKEHSYRGKAFWPIHPENCKLGTQFSDQLNEWISEGKIKPRPVKSLGQLSAQSVMKGIEMVRNGEVSNEKICFTVSEDK